MEETGASTSQLTREESLEEKKVRVGISDLNVYQKVIIIPLMLVVSNCMVNLGFLMHLSKSAHSLSAKPSAVSSCLASSDPNNQTKLMTKLNDIWSKPVKSHKTSPDTT